jgi:hypothetical protein
MQALAGEVHKTCASLKFRHAEIWRPRFTPNGSAVLELACSSTDVEPDGSRASDELRAARLEAADPLLRFAETSALLRFAEGYGLPGRVWVSAQPEFTPDLRAVPPREFMRGDMAAKPGLKSALGIPIAAAGSSKLEAVAVFFSGSADEPSVEIMVSLGMAMRSLSAALALLPPLPSPTPLADVQMLDGRPQLRRADTSDSD